MLVSGAVGAITLRGHAPGLSETCRDLGDGSFRQTLISVAELVPCEPVVNPGQVPSACNI